MGARPFTFDRAFPDTPERIAPLEAKEPTITLGEHERRLAAAAASARAEGHAEGRAAADADQAARLADAMEAVAAGLGALRHDLDGIAAAAGAEAVRFAWMLARALVGRLLDAAPLHQIEEAARLVFEDLRGQPHAAARVAPQLVEAARERLSAIARERGFDGRLVVLGEPEIALGDVRIEWADGGVALDRTAAEARIDDIVRAALAADGRNIDGET